MRKCPLIGVVNQPTECLCQLGALRIEQVARRSTVSVDGGKRLRVGFRLGFGETAFRVGFRLGFGFQTGRWIRLPFLVGGQDARHHSSVDATIGKFGCELGGAKATNRDVVRNLSHDAASLE